MSISASKIIPVAQVNGAVATTRTISTTAPITGGGDLSANRTIAISAASGAAAGSMSAAHYTLLANATDAATAGAIALRDAEGDAAFHAVSMDAGYGQIAVYGGSGISHAGFTVTITAGGSSSERVLVLKNQDSGTGEFLYCTDYAGTHVASLSFEGAWSAKSAVLAGSSGVTLALTAGDTANQALKITAKAGQTADLIDVYASNGSTLLAGIAADGRLISDATDAYRWLYQSIFGN